MTDVTDAVRWVTAPRPPRPTAPRPAPAERARRPPLAQAGTADAGLEAVIAAAMGRGASDIHLSVGTPPMIRVAGRFGALAGFGALDASQVMSAAAELVGGAAHTEAEEVDAAASYAGWRFRVNCYRQQGAPALALRAVPDGVPPFESLGLPDSVAGLAALDHGLVLACGPTGSGKSTTLAALVDLVNRDRAAHIVTIEDPIEFLHRPKRSVVHQRQVATRGPGSGDTPSFASGLRAALRQDPDVIMVGEMRDPITIGAALTAAETGHLVLSTLHAADAGSTITRIVDAFAPAQQQQVRSQLAATIRGIVCQVLAPHAEVHDRRVPVAEVLLATTAVANLIREGQTHQLMSQLQAGGERGMRPFDRALADAVTGGLVAHHDARGLARDPRAYEEYVRRAATAQPVRA